MTRPGTRIGRYELVAPLGKGGMGEVWEARLVGPQDFRRAVAVKLLPGGGTAEARAALVQEARLGGSVHHPNVVATTDLVFEDGLVAVVMDLVSGASLSQLIRAGAVTAGTAIEVGAQVAAGLAEVHRVGLIHRDVKPSNVMVDRFGTARLLDLGVARILGRAGAIAGTRGYLAPEQAEGTEDARADLWSLGATVGAAALGRPLLGSARDGYRAAPDDADLAELDRLRPGLGALVGACLRHDPSERPPDAGQLRERLLALRGSDDPFAGVRRALPPPATGAPTADPTSLRTPGNLPRPRTPILGRDAALAEVARAVTENPLVLLLGPGGAGKTRLAIAAAAAALPEFVAAWFVDLSDARTADEVQGKVSEVLQIRERDVARALADRGRTLLVLDNLEQVAAPAGALVARWLGVAPELAVLGTSRVRLGADEVSLPVAPLGPDAARALFLARCAPAPGQAPPDLALVDAIVARLEGSPLAIELAAARTRTLPLPRLLEALSDRLRVLAGDDPTRPARQRSVLAAVTSSLALLSPGTRAVFARLAVFRGGFDLPAAEAVASDPEGGWVLDALGELVDHSLLRYDPAADRFSLLETVREVAARALDPAATAAAVARHAAHFANLGDLLRRELPSDEAAPFAVLAREVDNLAAAVERGSPEVAIRALRGAAPDVFDDGDRDRWIRLARALAARSGAEIRAEALVWELAGERVRGAGPELLALAAACVAAAEGTAWRACAVLVAAALRPEAADLGAVAEAVAAERRAVPPDLQRQALTLTRAALVAVERRAPDAAEAWLDEAQALLVREGERRGSRRIAQLRASVAQLRGDLPGAVRALREDPPQRGYVAARAQNRLGSLLHLTGDLSGALEAFERAHRFALAAQDPVARVESKMNLGNVLARLGRRAEAEAAWETAAAEPHLSRAPALEQLLRFNRLVSAAASTPDREVVAAVRETARTLVAFGSGPRAVDLRVSMLAGPREEVERALAALPDGPGEARGRAQALAFLGRREEGLSALARAAPPSDAWAAAEARRAAALLAGPGAAEADLRALLAQEPDGEAWVTAFALHELGADVRGHLGALAQRLDAPLVRFVALCAAAERDRGAGRARLLAEAGDLAARFVQGDGLLARWLARASR